MVNVNLWLQQLRNPILDTVMQGVTMMGETLVLLCVLGVVYWCVDKDSGERMALILVSGLSVASGVKNIFRVPRPFVSDDRVIPMRAETATGYSFPSGHTMNATMAAGCLLGHGKRRLARALAIAAVALVMMSRVYLGVHTVWDVLGGLALGTAWVLVAGRLYAWCARRGGVFWALFLIPAALSLLGMLPLGHGLPPIEGDTVRALGLCLGVVGGVMLERRFIRFRARNTLPRNVIKLLFGAGGGLGLELGLKALLPAGAGAVIFRYAVVGLFLTAGVGAFSKLVLERRSASRKDTGLS